jgi:hypothetical protein
MGIVDGNCRVEIYIHLLELLSVWISSSWISTPWLFSLNLQYTVPSPKAIYWLFLTVVMSFYSILKFLLHKCNPVQLLCFELHLRQCNWALKYSSVISCTRFDSTATSSMKAGCTKSVTLCTAIPTSTRSQLIGILLPPQFKVTGYPFWRFAENRYCALKIGPISIK